MQASSFFVGGAWPKGLNEIAKIRDTKAKGRGAAATVIQKLTAPRPFIFFTNCVNPDLIVKGNN